MRNFLRRDAEPLTDQAREYRSVALPGVLHVKCKPQGAVTGKFEQSAFGRRAAGMFQHAADAEAAIFAALLRLALTPLDIVVIGKDQRLVEDRLEIAAVDDGADRRLV